LYGQGEYLLFFFFKSFPISGIAKLLQCIFLLALPFEIMQDICRRPVNASYVEIQS
jgi:uncharacterized protein (DUF3820 family)